MSLPKLITSILDFFYPLVGKIIPKKTYYYAACGGGNLLLSWLLFFLFYQFVFDKKMFPIQLPLDQTFVITAYTLSSVSCFIISFTIGFLLMKYVVFTGSELKGRVQLFRYALSSALSGVLSWLILKLFVEYLTIYPSIANVLASCIVVIFSYLMQRNFSFK
jgi:putative flippase GtrA